MRTSGEESAQVDVEKMRSLLAVIEPDWPLIADAARIKACGGLSYADTFCIATALRAEVPLWTGDPEIVAGAVEHSCEVIDLRG